MRVITYTLHECLKCMRCLKTCPMEAITIKNERVEISANKCINCGECINVCTSSGLTAKGSTLIDIVNYPKTVCLVPSSIYCDCANETQARQLNAALSKLGFDDLVYLSPYEGAIYKKVDDLLETNKQKLYISSFCPVVNELIQKEFPMLLENQNNFEYPAILAAKDVRKKYGQDVGIFLLCECPAKLSFGKYPYGNKDSEIDHCISIVDLFPLINLLRSQDEKDLELCEYGIKSVATGLGQRFDAQILSVNGLKKIQNALELCEFNVLKEVSYLSLSACFNGCIGGQFLWGNPFTGRINMHDLLRYATLPCKEYSLEEIRKENKYTEKQEKNILEQIKRFNQINEIFDQLPGFDCGACGYPSCRSMAEAIVDGQMTKNDCKILRKRG
ncbi:MAG: [Fe-Fe] hydrogenase large subunit C-terminal domain-containing protein [Traorella sp.]